MRVFVLADDLTGANATASLLKRQGLPSHTHIFGRAWAGETPASLHEDGVHVLDLDTRDRGDNETSDRVATAAARIGDTADLLGLRIDSTLRGPIPASLNTLLCDSHRLALVVPAFPASGRTTLGGVHYVHGTPLAETEVARDPVCPVTSSSVTEWIGDRLRVPWATLGLDDVRSGRMAMIARLDEQLAEGARAVFFDAQTDLDIEEIARAALAIGRGHTDVSLLPVDPGPFTAAVLRVMLEPAQLSPCVLGIVGSMMETSCQQMDFVEAGGYAYTVAYHGQSVADLLKAFEAAPLSTKALLLRTDTADLDAEARLHLYENLGTLFARTIERFPSIGGYFLSGGETAGQLLAEFGVQSLRMQSEILPLISLSRIVDGRLKGSFLVTKGGAVGDKSAIADAIGRLYDVLVDDGAASPMQRPNCAGRTADAVAAQ